MTVPYALLVDLDDTIVDSRSIEHLRMPGFWNQAVASVSWAPSFPGVIGALKIARASNWKIAIVTNSPPEYATAMLAHHQVPYDALVTHRCVGYNKPHKGYVEIALTRLGSSVGQAIGLGDSSNDLGCFRAARIPSIGAGWSPDFVFDARWEMIARSGGELVRILRNPNLDLGQRPTPGPVSIFPDELRRLSDNELKSREFLLPNDFIFYMMERIKGESYQTCPVHDFINNFKKSPEIYRNHTAWYYKERAIAKAAEALRRLAVFDFPVTYVPIPSSKARCHPGFDDRMLQALKQANPAWDVRDLIVQRESREALHTIPGDRRCPVKLAAGWILDETKLEGIASNILLVDDVLVKGTNFRAGADLLTLRIPNASIGGLFLAKHVLPPPPRFIDWITGFNTL